MSDRTIASRLRRIGVCLALPLAFAAVSAQAAGAMTFHPTNATDLFNDVTTANSTPGLNVIVLADQIYLPSGSQSMIITGNLEITGPPQLQPPQFNGGNPPEINGQNQQSSGKPLFTIASGANVIFKAFNLLAAGGPQWPDTLVNGGNLEVDNMTVAGNAGDGIDVSANPTSMLTVKNSLITSTLPPDVGDPELRERHAGRAPRLHNRPQRRLWSCGLVHDAQRRVRGRQPGLCRRWRGQ